MPRDKKRKPEAQKSTEDEDDKDLSPVAKKMAEWRDARKLKQKEMAEKLDISLSKLARTEVGILNPSVDLVLRLKNRLGISFDHYLSIDRALNPDEKFLETLVTDIRQLKAHHLRQVRKMVDKCLQNPDQIVKPMQWVTLETIDEQYE